MSSNAALPATVRSDRVRMVALMYPKDGLSFEEFDKYWLNEHSKVFTSIDIVKTNLLKYEQYHFNPTVNQMLQAQGGAAVPFVGMAIFEAESYEKVFEVFTHPDYQRVVVPDEARFFDRSKTAMIAGELATIIGL